MGKMTLQIVMDAGSTREGGSYRGGRVPLNDGPCSLGQSKRAQSLAGTHSALPQQHDVQQGKRQSRRGERGSRGLASDCYASVWSSVRAGEGWVRRVRRILV